MSAIAVLTAGCGGGGGSTPPETSSSSSGLIGSAQASTLPAETVSTALNEEVFSAAPTQALAESLTQASLPDSTADTPVSSDVTSESTVVADASVAAADTGADAAISGRATAAAVTTTTSCTALPALPAIPTNALKVTDFGAIPNDNLPDDDAISKALKALKPGQWLIFPAGRYIQAKSIYVTTPNAVLWGQSGAVLHATNPDDQTVMMNADGASMYGFTLTAVTDYRRTAARHARISIYRDGTQAGLQSGNVVRRNVITYTSSLPNGGSGGILVYRAKDFTVAENTIRRTLADGIHVTAGSYNGKVMFNTVAETGDDMIAMVSYMGAGWQSKIKTVAGFKAELPSYQVHDIYVANNNLGGNYWGRGVGIVGARNITISNNNIHDVTRAAGILIGQEANYYTFGTKNIVVTGNTISKIQKAPATYVPAADAALQKVLSTTNVTGHGGIEVYAYGNAAADYSDAVLRPFISVGDLRIENNSISEVVRDAVRIGVSSAAQLVGQSSIRTNTIKNINLKALNNVLPTTAKSYCTGNTKDGAAVTDASCTLTAAAAPVVTGAVLNCSGMLK